MENVMNNAADPEKEALTEAVTFSVDAYISEAYARAERDKLWRKVWQMAGRLEDIPTVGSFITYDILDDSLLIVRAADDDRRDEVVARPQGDRWLPLRRSRRRPGGRLGRGAHSAQAHERG
jgi:hypothetical protein